MNFNAAALRLMADKGLSALDIAEIAEANERRADPTATARQTDYPAGPRERWGYDGPITPRLSDNEWWPLRNSVIKRDDGQCNYCGAAGPRICVDHVVPLSRGGSNEPDNLVTCCGPCNVSKSDRLLSEWEGRA